MSKNFDELPAASALSGSETTPINQSGITKKTTISAIKTYLGTVFEALGAVSTGISAHLAAYVHGDIAHANRTALDAVTGTNTGDQDLTGYALKSGAVFTGVVTIPAISTGMVTITSSSYVVSATDTTIICNSAVVVTLTLPSAVSYPGRILIIKTIQSQYIISNTQNVVIYELGTSADTSILGATANKWTMLQSDGTHWIAVLRN